jgi:acetyltransferase
VHHIQTLTRLTAPDREQLIAVLADAVTNGASVGFVVPFTSTELEAYWDGIDRALEDGDLILFVLRVSGQIVATVQLAYATKSNARHRVEVQKMLVHSTHRRNGFGRTLLAAAEARARADGKTLLVLDTETTSAGQLLYEQQGFQVAGTIPEYAAGTYGGWTPSTFMYKLLGS